VAIPQQGADAVVLGNRPRQLVRDLEAVMEFDHNWEPGEHDTPLRRWVRRVAFVVAIVVFVWVGSLTMGGGW
jgi:hypothetical protein